MHNNNTKTELTHDAMLHEDMITGFLPTIFNR